MEKRKEKTMKKLTIYVWSDSKIIETQIIPIDTDFRRSGYSVLFYQKKVQVTFDPTIITSIEAVLGSKPCVKIKNLG